LEAGCDFGGAKVLEDGSVVAENLNALDGGVGAGEVGEPELVDEVGAGVGAGEEDGSVLDAEKDGGHLLGLAGAGNGSGEGDDGGEQDEYAGHGFWAPMEIFCYGSGPVVRLRVNGTMLCEEGR
jgi:hypothetical protein